MPLGSKLNPTLRNFIERQHVFFVASAAQDGRVNLSPKGADTLRIINDTQILWLNLSGSGNETAGHLARLNRLTMMFCAFEGDALILRLYGQVKTIHPRDEEWQQHIGSFDQMAGSRQLFLVTIDSVQTSCGSGVPFMNYEANRAEQELVPYYEGMGPEGVEKYWRKKNVETIDGFDTGLFET